MPDRSRNMRRKRGKGGRPLNDGNDEESGDAPRQHEVVISDAAEAEIDAVYLRLQGITSPTFADRWHEGLLLAIERLSLFPTGYTVAPESERLGYEVRRLVYRQGRVVYRVLFTVLDSDGDGETDLVRVLGIRHGAAGGE